MVDEIIGDQDLCSLQMEGKPVRIPGMFGKH